MLPWKHGNADVESIAQTFAKLQNFLGGPHTPHPHRTALFMSALGVDRQIAGKCQQMTGVRYACRKFVHVIHMGVG